MISKIFSFIAGIRANAIAISIYTVIVVSGTLYVHNKFIDAGKLKQTENQLEKAKEVPGKIIKFNQELRKTGLEKDTCAATDIPTPVLNLLRQ